MGWARSPGGRPSSTAPAIAIVRGERGPCLAFVALTHTQTWDLEPMSPWLSSNRGGPEGSEWRPEDLADDRRLRQKSSEAVKPPDAAAHVLPGGVGQGHTQCEQAQVPWRPEMLADDRSFRSVARSRDLANQRVAVESQIAGIYEFVRGRFEYFDRWLSDLQHESRRDDLDMHKRVDDGAALVVQTARRIEAIEALVTSLQVDLFESLRSERQAGDVRDSSLEELTRSKLEDMAGCLQDRVEGRLSSLHQVLHAQVEEVHVRADAIDAFIGGAYVQLSQLEAHVSIGSRYLFLLGNAEVALFAC